MSYLVKLEAFEGPLDLLLHLIDKHKVDIRDIPISSITDQYMEYLGLMHQLDLDIASEFLVMAATLMQLKARMLLPRPRVISLEESDPREELAERLLEYKRFKRAAAHLGLLEAGQSLCYTRPFPGFTRGLPTLDFLKGVDLDRLNKAFRDAMGGAEEDWTSVPPEGVSFRQRMREVLLLLKGQTGAMAFKDLVAEGASRLETIVTFLVILELARLRRACITQPDPFGEIEIAYAGGTKTRGAIKGIRTGG